MTSRSGTRTNILLNLSVPDLAARYAAIPCDGVGLMRAEFLAMSIGVHPRRLIAAGGADRFVEFFASRLAAVARAFAPRPVVYRTLDLKSNEYAGLEGGAEYEAAEENPMLGLRGCSRYLRDPESFRLELRAVARVFEEGLDNLRVMLPFVRFPRELAQCRRWAGEEGLTRHPGFALWMMAEVPSNVLLVEEFLPHADGVSIGTNDLTQLVLGIDRDSHRLAAEFDERDPAVLAAIARIVSACRARGVPVSMCGDAPSRHPELVARLVELGIDSLSVSAEAFEATVAAVREAERRQDAVQGSPGRTG